MSANEQSALEVFQQVFLFENLESGKVNHREITMRGTKWNLTLDYNLSQQRQLEIEITLNGSEDNVNFPIPVHAEFSFSIPSYATPNGVRYNVSDGVRYNEIFNTGQTSERLRMVSLSIYQLYLRCEVILFPGNHTQSSIPKVTVAESNFNKSLSEFLINKKFTDVSIVVNGREIKAHKVVLSAASPVFLSLLDNNQENKIEINDIDHDTMVQVVTCIYMGKAPDLENSAEKVLVAADRYQLDWLKTECEDILMKKIDTENACNFLMKGALYNADQLKEGARYFITENIADVKKTDGFRKLGESHLHLLLEILQCCNGIGIGSLKGRAQKVTVGKDVIIN